MQEYFHKWFSQYISREFEMLVFGREGLPVIFFPPAKERYYYAKDSGFIDSAAELIDAGIIKIYCPDSYDLESFYDFNADPSDRIRRYTHFESLIIHDIIGFTKYETDFDKVILSGEEFGGYHAMNFGLKHPELTSGIITLHGIFDIKQFIYGYYNDDCYFNNPADYLPGLEDEWYLSNINKIKIYLSADPNDKYFEENRNISSLLSLKGIYNQFRINNSEINNFTWQNEFSSILHKIIRE